MPERPCLLVILTDQQRHDTIAALGAPVIRTPNLDRLVREGVAFPHAFSPAPVCVPARACLHYGQYPGRTRCFANAYPMPDDRPSYADLLSAAGYDTVGIGKCHFTPDRQALRGFRRRWRQEEIPPRIEDDDFLQFLQQSPYRRIRDVHGTWGDMVYMPQTSPLPADHHPTQWIGDRTVEFIEQAARGNNESPWMAFCSFIHPHPPYAPPAGWDMMYDPDEIPLPQQLDADLGQQNYFIRQALRNYYFDAPVSEALWRLVRARYYACISFVDHQVGRILEALEATGQLDRTVIVFTSDHGEMLGDRGLIAKEDMYGPSVRIPLVMRHPDGPAGRVVRTATSLVDVPATMLGSAGLTVPPDWDGEDLLAIARRDDDPSRIVLSQVHEHARGHYLAADGRYAYSHSAADERSRLCDYAADPHELVDRLDDPACTAVRTRLHAALLQYLRETDQEDALDDDRTTWRRWPAPGPMRPRRRSGMPCPWAESIGLTPDTPTTKA